MEWQDEFDVNVYDFGARNYDPALVKTFTPDPMAEKFYHLSPYSFLNNNPLSTIDPTGALSITITGQDAQDFFQGLKDDIASRPKKKEEWFDDVWDDPPGNGKNGGGKCPDGDCDGMNEVRKRTAIPIGDTSISSSSSQSKSIKEDPKPKPTGGRYVQLSTGFAFIGGFGLAVGKVYDASGNSKWYLNFDGNIGFGADWNLDAGVIEPTGDHSFIVNDFGGNSGSYNGGLAFYGLGASYHKGGSLEKNWSGRKKINPLYFGKTDKEGYRTKQGGVGRGTGFRAGGYYSYGTTKVFN